MTDWKTSFFGTSEEYDEFVADMKGKAKEDTLPALVSMTDTNSITLDEVRSLIEAVKNDTGLEAEATFYLCQYCPQLHLMLIVDFPDEDDVFPVVQ